MKKPIQFKIKTSFFDAYSGTISFNVGTVAIFNIKRHPSKNYEFILKA